MKHNFPDWLVFAHIGLPHHPYVPLLAASVLPGLAETRYLDSYHSTEGSDLLIACSPELGRIVARPSVGGRQIILHFIS
jgi:hypothetical protein